MKKLYIFVKKKKMFSLNNSCNSLNNTYTTIMNALQPSQHPFRTLSKELTSVL